ncbi:unnamed protein product [Allacma fusca]|uniref:Uncharacterized protein n=1 Tax=Allacma fusca TaxID=39272 RepID=A0A8J2P8U2_9HEXA|nr:unnamed protein product [Allacma fusca]
MSRGLSFENFSEVISPNECPLSVFDSTGKIGGKIRDRIYRRGSLSVAFRELRVLVALIEACILCSLLAIFLIVSFLGQKTYRTLTGKSDEDPDYSVDFNHEAAIQFFQPPVIRQRPVAPGG